MQNVSLKFALLSEQSLQLASCTWLILLTSKYYHWYCTPAINPLPSSSGLPLQWKRKTSQNMLNWWCFSSLFALLLDQMVIIFQPFQPPPRCSVNSSLLQGHSITEYVFNISIIYQTYLLLYLALFTYLLINFATCAGLFTYSYTLHWSLSHSCETIHNLS